MDPERMAEKLELRRCRRPVQPGDEGTFELTYVRTGGADGPPVLVVPGGPGLGSILPYVALRHEATRRGLDLLMVEHRGVGFSRTTDEGHDLPPEALTLDRVVEDLVAVLDDAGVDRVVLYGSSYGSYVVQLLGVRHPDRVAGMVLDSPMVRAGDHDRVRRHARALLWDGERAETATAAALLRDAVDRGAVDAADLSAVVQPVFEFAGPDVLSQLLALRLAGRGDRLWQRIADLGERELTKPTPYVMEFDLVGRIAFRELGYAPEPDGLPLDANLAFLGVADRFPAFEAEPADLPACHAELRWPVAVLSGERDLRTPRPVAEELVAAAPDAVLVPLATTGHSALDTHRVVALHAMHAVQVGGHQRLPTLAERLSALPRRGSSRLVGTAIAAAVRARSLVPAITDPRSGTRLSSRR